MSDPAAAAPAVNSSAAAFPEEARALARDATSSVLAAA